MRKNNDSKKIFLMICLTIIILSLTFSSPQEERESIKLQSFKLPEGINEARLISVGGSLNFQNWPKTEVRHVAPLITKTYLSKPDLVTQETVSYSYVQFDDTYWGRCQISWNYLVEKKRPLYKDLSSNLKEKLLAKLHDEQRKNSEFVKRYLENRLERFQKLQKYQLKGEMDVEICLAPSSQAAHEYLLFLITENNLPTEDLIKIFAIAKQPEGLGDISFLSEFREKKDIHIRFIRDNICISILANGYFAEDVLHLARKIDAMIIKQPPLSYEQLINRRPTIDIGSKVKDKREVSYEISVPVAQRIVFIRAYIDDRGVMAKEGIIPLEERKGEVKVKLVAITKELLANSFEKMLVVDD